MDNGEEEDAKLHTRITTAQVRLAWIAGGAASAGAFLGGILAWVLSNGGT